MYFVCTREEDDCKELYGGAWGYYRNREDAVRAVHKNVTDIHETIYPYAIIERLEPGLFPVPKEREWFGWDEEKDGFYEIETPECNKYFPRNFSVALGTVGDENSMDVRWYRYCYAVLIVGYCNRLYIRTYQSLLY